MLEFLLAALTTATVAALLIPLLRSRVAATDRLDNDLAVYRDQLAEVERERAAGTLPEPDAAAAKIEIERPRRRPRCTATCRPRSACWFRCSH